MAIIIIIIQTGNATGLWKKEKKKRDKYVNNNLHFESKHSSNAFIEKET